MQGLSPRPHSLSPQQIQISNTIAETVTELPTTVTDLISEMAVPDFSIATIAPELTLCGTVMQTERNRQIVLHIDMALTAPSSECDPRIKAQIFDTAAQPGSTGRTIKPYLIELINKFQEKGLQLNLDDVELNRFNFVTEYASFFNDMSAQRATFANLAMRRVNLRNADLTGAKFFNSDLSHANFSKANITNATFSNVTFQSTEACELIGNQSTLANIYESHPVLMSVNGEVCTADRTFLTGYVESAVPDRETFTLPTDQNATSYFSNYGDYPSE